jgi:hypothetical protein
LRGGRSGASGESCFWWEGDAGEDDAKGFTTEVAGEVELGLSNGFIADGRWRDASTSRGSGERVGVGCWCWCWCSGSTLGGKDGSATVGDKKSARE